MRNIENVEKWKMHTVGPGVWQENWNHGKWEKDPVWPGIWRKILKKRGKWEMHIVWHEISWETLKNMKNIKCTL
jgi:hypothetical protein